MMAVKKINKLNVGFALSWLILAGLALSALGCGSASSNDQGTSFTLFGFFKAPCGSGAGDSGTVFPIDQDFEVDQGINLAAYENCYGVQNNLTNEGIRLEVAFMDYFIPGASVQPPSTAQPIGSVLGPAGVADTGDDTDSGGAPTGSLPPGFDFANETQIGIFILPPDIIAWLSLNRASLPELPFLMRVNTYVSGVTTSGNRLETNRLSYPIDFVVGNEIEPSGESEDTGGAGGIIDGGTTDLTPSGDEGDVDLGGDETVSEDPDSL